MPNGSTATVTGACGASAAQDHEAHIANMITQNHFFTIA
jgi:hypothetical protein